VRQFSAILDLLLFTTIRSKNIGRATCYLPARAIPFMRVLTFDIQSRKLFS
jgi:hypothetical protein